MLGTTLKSARESRNLSLGALSQKTGIAKSTLSRWESRQSVPHLESLRLVLDALAVPEELCRQCLQAFEVPRALRYLQASPSAPPLGITGGELLRVLRQRSGKTQAEVARQLGITQGQISKWETDEQVPSCQQLHEYGHATGATESELLGLTQRDWATFKPLPNDKETLDQFLLSLAQRDTLIDRDLLYLTLASRYTKLYRENRISKAQSLGIWGHYGHYVGFQYRYADGARLAAACLDPMHWESHYLDRGTILALVAHKTYLGKQNRLGEALKLTHDLHHRIPHQELFFWIGSAAGIARDAGEADMAIPLYHHALAVAPCEARYYRGQQQLSRALCQFGRFRDAQALLESTSSGDSRISVQIERELLTAWSLQGQGALKDAETHVARAQAQLAVHPFHDLCTLANQLSAAAS